VGVARCWAFVVAAVAVVALVVVGVHWRVRVEQEQVVPVLAASVVPLAWALLVCGTGSFFSSFSCYGKYIETESGFFYSMPCCSGGRFYTRVH